jgi:two-component system, response regulator YesN
VYKVLIVDDERLVREGIKIILAEEKLSVEITGEARNGQEALDFIREKTPHIVITDIRMPVLDGISLIRSARELYKDIKFVIISGFTEFEYARSALEMGVTNYVLKPIKNEELARALKKTFQEIDEKKSVEKDREIKQLVEKENIGLLVEKSLNALLFEQEPTGDICSRLYVRMPELKEVYCLLGIFHIDHPGTYESCFMEDDFDLVRFSVKNILEEVCGHTALSFSNFKDKTELFVLWHHTRETHVICDGPKFLLDVFMKIKTILPISITVGVSDVLKDISSLTKGYSEAKSALERRFVQGGGRLYRYGDLKVISRKEFHFPEYKLQTLKVCLDRVEMDHGLEEVENVVAGIFSAEELEHAAPLHLKMLFIQTLRSVTMYCEQMKLNISDFISERDTSGEILADFSSSRDIEKYIVSLIKRIYESGEFAATDIKTLIRRIEEYLKSNFHKDISLDILTQQYKVSVKYLSRAFKNITGRNFSDYLSEIRMNKAKELLEKTQLTVYDIAISVGYGDPQYFHRVFKKYFGVTPNEYRTIK